MSPADLRAEALRFAGLRTLLPMLPSFVRMALDMNFMSPGIFGGEQFLRFLGSFCPLREGAFTDLRIPFRAVATDIETGARVELGEGRLAEALRASFSAPWIFTPHQLAGRMLVDGGMADPVPSETVRSMGADLVIAVNVVPALDPRAPSLFDFGLRMIDRLNPLSYVDRRRPLNSSFDVVMKCLSSCSTSRERPLQRSGRAHQSAAGRPLVSRVLGRDAFMERAPKPRAPRARHPGEARCRARPARRGALPAADGDTSPAPKRRDSSTSGATFSRRENS
jgi:predicted acylesterase/phospholipase RssA